MRRGETLMALALVVGAGVLLREALRLPFRWTSVGPGAGFFPFWLALGVVACAVIVWLQSLRAPATTEGAAPPPAPPGPTASNGPPLATCTPPDRRRPPGR